jgi:thiamine-monophosphate kinase
MERFGEREAIALLDRVLGAERGSGAEVGIGDDAAVIRAPAGRRLVWTVDVQVEHVHFERRWLSLEDVGWRSFQAAVSDLAAMGARPLAALSSLVLPPGFARTELARLARGQAAAARCAACPIVGGNLSRGSELGITTSVLGLAKRPLLRSGARAGEEIWLVGAIGLARAGLLLLERKLRARSPAERACLAAWRRPEALLSRGDGLVRRASSAVDVSDGLAQDVRHLARASGVKLVLEERLVRRALPAELEAVSARLGEDPLALALEGGEDYALLATGPKRLRPRWARKIGRVERGRGVSLERADGRRLVVRGGFDHLARTATTSSQRTAS